MKHVDRKTLSRSYKRTTQANAPLKVAGYSEDHVELMYRYVKGTELRSTYLTLTWSEANDLIKQLLSSRELSRPLPGKAGDK